MIITSFAAGELSPSLNGRSDIAQYFSGVSRMENFVVIPTGGIKRRTGFARTGRLSGQCRLIPFILDADTSFIFEFLPERIYIWKNGVQMVDIDGEKVVIETGYNSIAEINEIQYAQNYDTMIFVQRNHPPFSVRWDFATGTFEYGDMAFNFHPEIHIDDDFGFVLKPEGELPAAGVDGQFCLFEGTLYQFNAEKQEWEAAKEPEGIETDTEMFAADDKYPGCVAFFNNRLWLASTNRNRQKVWASRAPDSSGTKYNDFSTYNRYITTNKVLRDADIHLFSADIKMGDISGGKTLLTNVSQDLTQVISEDETDYYVTGTYIPVGAKVITMTSTTIQIDKAAVITEDQRAQVMSVQLWKTATTPSSEDYETTTADTCLTTSDCAFFFEIASDQNDAIRWLATNRSLVLGTESSVWFIPPSVTALSIAAELNGRFGSDSVQGRPVDAAVIFLSHGRKGIREYYYSGQSDGFRTNDIAVLADHLMRESRAVDFVYMSNPYSRIIITREDGTAAVLLYDKTNGIMAWARLTHGRGKIESCAVTRGTDGVDLVYAAVRYGDEWFLEVMDESREVYLDGWEVPEKAGEDVPGGGTEGTPGDGDGGVPDEDGGEIPDTRNTEDGTGENGEGFVFPDEEAVIYNASTGKILRHGEDPEGFAEEGDTVYCGWEYTSMVRSMPVVNSVPDSRKRIVDLIIRFEDSFFPVVRCGDRPDELFSGDEPFSGVKKIIFPGSSERDVYFSFYIRRPERCRVLCVNAELSQGG